MRVSARTILRAAVAAAVLVSGPALARTVWFSGRTWDVKTSTEPVGPGPNVFSDSTSAVYVDSNNWLHLTVARRNNRWESTEIVGRESLGYGTYAFDIAPGATTIADNAVFGLFTYDVLPADNHREVDIELSKWGDGRTNNLQCSVQPADAPDLYQQFLLTENTKGWIFEFKWLPGAFSCRVINRATGAILSSRVITRGVPRPGGEKVRLNLWQFRGAAPLGDKPSAVTVKSFTFTPA